MWRRSWPGCSLNPKTARDRDRSSGTGGTTCSKCRDDLDFVSEALGSEAWRLACFCRGNPLLLTRDEIRGVGKARDVGRLQAASVVILDVVRRKKADEVVARSGRKRRQIEKIEDREEDIGEKYKSARTGEATPSSVKKTPMRTGEGPARRRLAEVRGGGLGLRRGGPGRVGC